MPTVQFHILSSAGDDARLRHACALVEQAQQAQQRVFVRVSDEAMLRRVDDLLWTFRDHAFIPHELLTSTPHARSVAVLGIDEPPPTGFNLLINLHDSLPPQLTAVAQIMEVVDAEPSRKQQARERYKHYRDAGYQLETLNH